MNTFITIIYVIVAFVMVLSILLQSGKGGGLGSALGGGASQSVFGGGGGVDFMSKLTQGFAFTFMISAMYLAYASAHAGSKYLEGEDQGSVGMIADDEEINPERLGPRPQRLPSAEEGKAMQADASALVPAQSEAAGADPAALPAALPDEGEASGASAELPAENTTPEDGNNPLAKIGMGDQPAEEPASGDEKRGDSPTSERGDSPRSGEENLQDAPLNSEKTEESDAKANPVDGAAAE